MVMKGIKPFVLEGGKTITENRKDRKTPSWAGMHNIPRTSLFIDLSSHFIFMLRNYTNKQISLYIYIYIYREGDLWRSRYRHY